MITRILLLALATTVVGLNAQEAPTTGGEKPKREGRGQGGQGGERKEGFPGLTAEEQAKVKAALEDEKVKKVIQKLQQSGGLDFNEVAREDPRTA